MTYDDLEQTASTMYAKVHEGEQAWETLSQEKKSVWRLLAEAFYDACEQSDETEDDENSEEQPDPKKNKVTSHA